MTIERLAERRLVLPEARWGEQDPTRRQLAERAQRAGVVVQPRIEVQHAGAALELAARGLADTLVTDALLDVLGYRDRLAARAARPTAVRDVRVHPAPQRPPLAGHPRAHDARRSST